MTDHNEQNPQEAELSPAEKLAQPVAQDTTEPDQLNTNGSETNTKKQTASKTPIKSQGVPVAKLSGIGIPVAVVLFVLAFLWKGPVFALGVLAAIALALAVVWAVRTIAARPTASRSATREVAPTGTSRTTRTSHTPQSLRGRNSGAGSGGGTRNSTNRNSHAGGRFPWNRRPGADGTTSKASDRQPGGRKPGDQSKQNPAASGSKGRSPAVDPNKGKQQPATGRPPASNTTDRNTTKAPSGTKPPQGKAPSSTTTKSTQGSQGRPGSNGGSSASRPSQGGGKTPDKSTGKSPALVKMVDPAPPVRPSNAKGTDGDRDRTDRDKGGGTKDRATNGGGDASKPKTAREKSNATEPKKQKKDKEEKKTADTSPATVKRPSAPVDPRTQWVVQPQATTQQPTDPKIEALAEKVRAVGGATATPALPVVASLEEKRHRNLGDAIRQAGETPAPPVRQPVTGPAETISKKDDQERHDAMYGYMINTRTPELRAASLQRVSEKARKDQRRLMDEADELRSAAAALPDYATYDEERSELLAQASRLDEEAEVSGHWATAADERAAAFAREREQLAL